MSGSKAGRGIGRGGGRGGTSKDNLDSRGRSEGVSSQAKITCTHCQKPGHIRPNCPERHCFKFQGWGHEAVSCPPKVPTPKENVVEEEGRVSYYGGNTRTRFKVTAETKLDEIDGGDTACFVSVEIGKHILTVGKETPKTTVERWVADSGCSQFIVPSADHIINYREGGDVVRTAAGRAMPIEGIGNLPMSFWSVKDWVQVVLSTSFMFRSWDITCYRRRGWSIAVTNTSTRKREWHYAWKMGRLCLVPQ